MKTLKLALVATLVAFMFGSVSYADGFRSNPKFKMVVNLKFEKAVQNPEMLILMYQQIHKEDVLTPHQFNYVAEVVGKGTLYRITGSKDQWIQFFRVKGTPTHERSKGPVID
jgi:hypothetical protein